MKQFIDKLIERLGKLGWVYADYYPDETAIHRQRKKSVAYEEVVEIVNQLAEEYAKDTNVQTIDVSELLGEQGNDGWIPCSERLPDKSMCTDDSGFVTVETTEVLENGERVTFIEDYSLDAKEFLTPYKVIAWRNRPQPYQPKGKPHD